MSESDIRRDPIEDDPKYRAVVAEAERLAWAELAERGMREGCFGACHWFWPAKQRILRERFGIEWQSPRDLNPHVRFD
jgi:hypothetical protein